MIPVLQGAVAGGAALYLFQSQNREKKAQNVWLNTNLMINHLFLITGLLLKNEKHMQPTHSLSARYFFLATPVLLALNFRNKERKISHLELSITNLVNRFYFIAAASAAIALVMLGNRGFGLSFTTTIVVFLFIQSKPATNSEEDLYDIVKVGAAILALASYSARVFDGTNVLHKVCMTATLVEILVTKLRNQSDPDFPKKKDTPNDYSKRTDSIDDASKRKEPLKENSHGIETSSTKENQTDPNSPKKTNSIDDTPRRKNPYQETSRISEELSKKDKKHSKKEKKERYNYSDVSERGIYENYGRWTCMNCYSTHFDRNFKGKFETTFDYSERNLVCNACCCEHQRDSIGRLRIVKTFSSERKHQPDFTGQLKNVKALSPELPFQN